jgi:hypothetical protein
MSRPPAAAALALVAAALFATASARTYAQSGTYAGDYITTDLTGMCVNVALDVAPANFYPRIKACPPIED